MRVIDYKKFKDKLLPYGFNVIAKYGLTGDTSIEIFHPSNNLYSAIVSFHLDHNKVNLIFLKISHDADLKCYFCWESRTNEFSIEFVANYIVSDFDLTKYCSYGNV